MSEKSQRQAVLKRLKDFHAIPVENPVHAGTPDINCSLGWIELKWLRRWPKSPDDIVRIPHFTPRQRRWLRKRWNTDQRAWLLLQCGREWLLFDGAYAAQYVGCMTRRELINVCLKHWTGGLDKRELICWLT